MVIIYYRMVSLKKVSLFNKFNTETCTCTCSLFCFIDFSCGLFIDKDSSLVLMVTLTGYVVPSSHQTDVSLCLVATIKPSNCGTESQKNVYTRSTS